MVHFPVHQITLQSLSPHMQIVSTETSFKLNNMTLTLTDEIISIIRIEIRNVHPVPTPGAEIIKVWVLHPHLYQYSSYKIIRHLGSTA